MPEVPPYHSLANIYDDLIGRGFFPHLRRNFEQLERRYGLRFSSAADIACGTGLFLKYLNKRGVPKLYGIDRSLAMIHKASQHNQGTGIVFQQQDMTELKLPDPVDLLTCNFDSLNYLLEPNLLKKAFQRFSENLKPDGVVMFDMITRNQPWCGVVPIIEKRQFGILNFLRSIQLNKETGLQSSRVVISSPTRIMSETHMQRAYSIILVLKLLRKAGIRLLGMHDFANLEPVTPDTRRITIIANRL